MTESTKQPLKLWEKLAIGLMGVTVIGGLFLAYYWEALGLPTSVDNPVVEEVSNLTIEFPEGGYQTPREVGEAFETMTTISIACTEALLEFGKPALESDACQETLYFVGDEGQEFLRDSLAALDDCGTDPTIEADCRYVAITAQFLEQSLNQVTSILDILDQGGQLNQEQLDSVWL